MEDVLNQLVKQLPKGKTGKRIDVYAEFVSGRPDLDADGRQFQGYKILLFVAVPQVNTITDDLYKRAHFDTQIKVELDASFTKIDLAKSRMEIEKLINKL